MQGGKASFTTPVKWPTVIGLDHVLIFFVTSDPFFNLVRSVLKMVYSVNVCMHATATDGATGIAEK